MIVDRYPDLREHIKFRFFAKLSNGIVGKIITIPNTTIESNYLVTENGDIYNINSEKKVNVYIGKDPKNKDALWYPIVRLKYVTNDERSEFIHRLVALAFIPNPENKPTVNHKDGNKLTPHVENLEWATFSENNTHALVMGLRSSPKQDPETCWLTTHTKDEVLHVAKLLENGISPKNIVSNYGYTYEFVYKIYNRETWKEVTKDFKFPPITRTKHSNIFTSHELYKMIKLFIDGKTVREVISEMGWEFNERTRSRVKFIKYNVDRGRYTIEQYNKYCESQK